MKTFQFLCVVLLTSTIVHTASAQLNWTIKGNGAVENNGKYLLVNNSNGKPLKYGKRDMKSRAAGCINIVWGSAGEAQTGSNFIQIVRQPGASGPIKTGERVALRFEGGGYLRHEKQTIGVNLGWMSSNTPNVPYEFEIRTQANKIGETVMTNTPIALFNHTAGDWMAYCKRSDPGINLGWPGSCSGCSRSGYDYARDYLPISQKVIGEIKKRQLDCTDLWAWCSDL